MILTRDRSFILIYLANKQIKSVATNLREICSRNSVEPGFREKLIDASKKLEDFYSSTQVNFKINDKVGYSERELVFCHDIEGLVKYILDNRGYSPFNHTVRLGLDGCGSVFF